MSDDHAHREVRTRARRVRVRAAQGGAVADRIDRVATEEPLEIRVGGLDQEAEALVVTMRTPGDDFELAAGFLHTEGFVATHDEIEALAYCRDGLGRQEYNVVTVRLRRPWDASASRRNFVATAACGICGKAALDQVERHCAPVISTTTVDGAILHRLPSLLSRRQAVFEETGGLHAAGLFDAAGELLDVREDVGRHNALDKLIGRAFLDGATPWSDRLVLVSGRASFELVQKAAVAGAPVLCAVSAPSSLAVDAAERFGITLVGFLRGDGFNVYTHAERVQSEPGQA